jgi:hypothetical protein
MPTILLIKTWERGSLTLIQRRITAYNFGNVCIERLMKELHYDYPTAVEVFQSSIVQLRQEREARLGRFAEALEQMDDENED